VKPSHTLRNRAAGADRLAAACSRRHFLYALSAAAIGQFFPPRLIRTVVRLTPIFSDVTTEAGIAWRQFNGFSPDRYLIETMGGGVGLFDFDEDGWLDIFLLNGGETPRGKAASKRAVSQFGQRKVCRCCR
jgi:hypothetical protein